MTNVLTIETSSLGDRSYLATDGTVALVVDPQRDIDRIVALAENSSLRITHVLETHTHNDYVSGGLELAALTGATYVLPVGSGAEFDHTRVTDGDAFEVGDLRVSVLHTPGHTHHHVAYTVAGPDGRIDAAFTGGSMLFGSTGRTDLVGPDETDGLTRAQFHSVRRLADEVPDNAQVHPTHGFGSFCSATPTSGDSSTVGEQRGSNPALTLDESAYVETLLAGLDAYPTYYAHMGPLNRQGPAPVDLSPPEPVDNATLRAHAEAGDWVVDLRARTAFAAGHLPGTLSFELDDSFVTYVGWLIPWKASITLLGETAEQVAEARRELSRIGIDKLAGAAVGDIADLADGRPLRSYPVSDFAGLADERQRSRVHVLDARRNDERAQGHVVGSQHIPVHELGDRIEELPDDGEIWVYCGSGYRASIAASMLDRAGRQVVHVDETYDAARAARLEQEPQETGG